MNDQMKKEILENWFSWKYDIIDCNRSEWTQRDQAIIETIDQILLKELDDRKTKRSCNFNFRWAYKILQL